MDLDRSRVIEAAKRLAIPCYIVARRAGLTETRLYRLLRSRTALHSDELEALAKTLGVSPVDLLEPALDDREVAA